MKFDSFIWDFDGTLFDSYDAITRAFLRAAEDMRIDIAFQDQRWLVKHSLSHAARELAARFQVDMQALMARYRLHADSEETVERLQPYPGAKELLCRICECGGANYLYTHRDMLCMDALHHWGMDAYVQGAVTREDPFPRKPAPDALLHLMAVHGLEPGRCIMIGDRRLDVEAGLNAGIAAALFDPEGFCGGDAPTALQFTSMEEIGRALVDCN